MSGNDGIAGIARELWQDGRGVIFLFLSLGWILTFGARQIFPVFFPTFRDEFHLGLGTLGLMYSMVWMVYALGQFPGGMLADRFSERTILVWGTVLTAGSIFLVGIAWNVVALTVGMLVFGIVTASYGPTKFTVLTDIYEEYDGTAVGLLQASGQVGNTILPVVASFIGVYVGWRMGFFYLIPLLGVTAIGLWWSMPTRTATTPSPAHRARFEVRETLRTVITIRTLKLTAILALGLFVIQGLAGFYPTYLTDEKGMSMGVAAMLYGLLFFTAVVIQPTFGMIGDVLEPRKTLLFAVGLTIVGLVWLPYAGTLLQLLVITIFLGHYFALSPVIIPPLTNALPVGAKGTGLGFVRTLYFLIGATGSIFVGWFADAGYFDQSFFVLAGAMGIVAVLVATTVE